MVDDVASADARPENQFGARLRRAREHHQVSLREMARRLHRSHSNLWEYERGHRFPPAEIVRDYMDALGLASAPLLAEWEAVRFELFGDHRRRRVVAPIHDHDHVGHPARAGHAPVAPTRLRPVPAGAVDDPRFVGRGAEREALGAWIGEALAGEPRLVVVHGGPGVGKSWLASHVLAGLPPDVLRLMGTCLESNDVAYLPVVTALRPLLAAAAGPGDAGAGLDLLPALAAGAAPDPVGSGVLDAQLMLFLTWTQALLSAVGRQPVVLLLEDLHWADDATAALLGYLVSTVAQQGAVSPTRLVVLLTTRGVTPRSPAGRALSRLVRERWYRELTLKGLAAGDLGRVVADAHGVAPSPRLLDLLVDATDGNPYLACSITRRLADAGKLRVDARGELDLAAAHDDGSLLDVVLQVPDDALDGPPPARVPRVSFPPPCAGDDQPGDR
jgi:transcriptional regulator with XRE-family HTH domain